MLSVSLQSQNCKQKTLKVENYKEIFLEISKIVRKMLKNYTIQMTKYKQLQAADDQGLSLNLRNHIWKFNSSMDNAYLCKHI